MIATLEQMEDVAKDIFVPEAGATESDYGSFDKWYQYVWNHSIGTGATVSDFDIVSIVDMYDEDLREYSILRKGTLK